MTKVPMPEPVAFGIFYSGVMQGWAWGKEAAQDIAEEDYPKVPTSVKPIITTDQAEAYAAAKVREALEAVAGAAHDSCIKYCNGHTVNFEDELNDAIRSLTP